MTLMVTRNLFIFALVFSGLANGAPTPLNPHEIERRLIELIISGHKLPLDPTLHAGCKKKTRSVGELYSQMMNEYVFGAGKEKVLKISCAAYDAAVSPFKAPKKNETPVECTIQHDWKNETGTGEKIALTARITRSGKGLERKYLACQIPN